MSGEVLLFLNFGHALTVDGGKRWRLLCEEVYAGTPVGPNNIVYTPGGRLLLAHLQGLLGSNDAGCGFAAATGVTSEVAFSDVALDPTRPETHVWAIAQDALFESLDGGRSVRMVKRFTGETLLRLAVSPTDPKGVALLSVVTRDGVRFRLHASADGGQSFASSDSAFAADELIGLRVGLRSPRALYFVRKLGKDGVDGAELYRLDDAAQPGPPTRLFAATAESDPGLSGAGRQLVFALGPGADELWVGKRGDDARAGTSSLQHSTDGGRTFKMVAGGQPHFRCLERLDDKLWSCGNNLLGAGDAFAVGVSSDGGAGWRKVFSFGELCEAFPCAGQTCAPVMAQTCVPGLCAPGAPPVESKGGSCAVATTRPTERRAWLSVGLGAGLATAAEAWRRRRRGAVRGRTRRREGANRDE